MAAPRIGRPDVIVAHRAGGDSSRRWRTVTTPLPVSDVATRAQEIADGLGRLTQLTGSVRRRFGGDAERRARLDRLHERAIECWRELSVLAMEAAGRARPR